jgi:hypothetical protein
MPTLTDKFKIIELTPHAQLNREELEQLLSLLPIKFETVDEPVSPQEALYKPKDGIMEVYHDAGVVSFYPPSGKRLYNACLFDMDFPIRPDNIMDDTLGLRCCFHPDVTSFGMFPRTFHGDTIELSIYKYSKKNRYGNNR